MPGPHESITEDPADGSILPIPSLSCSEIIEVLREYASPQDLRENLLLAASLEVHHEIPRLHRSDCPLRDPKHWVAEFYQCEDDLSFPAGSAGTDCAR